MELVQYDIFDRIHILGYTWVRWILELFLIIITLLMDSYFILYYIEACLALVQA